LTYNSGSKTTEVISYMGVRVHLFTYTVLTFYTVIVNYFVNVFNYTVICLQHLYYQHTKMSAVDPREVFSFIYSFKSSMNHHFEIDNIFFLFHNILFTWNLLGKLQFVWKLAQTIFILKLNIVPKHLYLHRILQKIFLTNNKP